MTAGAVLGIQHLTLEHQFRIQGGDGRNGDPVDGYRIASWQGLPNQKSATKNYPENYQQPIPIASHYYQ